MSTATFMDYGLKSLHNAKQLNKTITILGAGASGLTCAIRCAQILEQHGLSDRVTIEVLESSRKVGHSIMASGNGRCNFSHLPMAAQVYRNASFVQDVFDTLEQQDIRVLSWFEDLGLVWEESDERGMLFPVTNQAATVLTLLLQACDRYNIQLYTQTKLTSCKAIDASGQFEIRGERSPQPLNINKYIDGLFDKQLQRKQLKALPEPEAFTSQSLQVVVATGHGLATSEALQDFLKPHVTPFHWVLGPLETKEPDGKLLDGLRCKARITLTNRGFDETGEVLFRSYGLSGIVIFNLSRFCQAGDVISLDLAPELTEEALHRYLRHRLDHVSQLSCEQWLSGLVAVPLARVILERMHINPETMASEALLKQVLLAVKQFMFTVERIADDQSCQVMRGGYQISHVDPTLASRLMPGCYVLGEALDVDAPCGGYNLHWAWTTGLVAGSNLAQAVMRSLS